jgi:hypothetical protein
MDVLFFLANSIDNLVFPTAVGPDITINKGILALYCKIF